MHYVNYSVFYHHCNHQCHFRDLPWIRMKERKEKNIDKMMIKNTAMAVCLVNRVCHGMTSTLTTFTINNGGEGCIPIKPLEKHEH